MNRATDDVCIAMQEVRRKGRQDVSTIHESLETLLDWRGYLTRHPLITLGGAALLGVVLAPRAKKLAAADLDKLADRLQSSGALSDGEAKQKAGAFARYILPLVAMAGPPLARVAVAGILAKLASKEHVEVPTEPQYD